MDANEKVHYRLAEAGLGPLAHIKTKQ